MSTKGPKEWSPLHDAENRAYVGLTALLKDLQKRYPQIGLTFGYIGNIETWGDDRHWNFFTQVPIESGYGLSRMRFGSYTTAELPRFLKDAQEKLEPWIQKQALPRLKKERGGTMSGPKDWQPAPLQMDDPRVKALRARIRKAISEADHAFWAAIVKELPEVESGDFGPDDTYKWESAAEEAVITWLSYNYPHEFLIQPIIDHYNAGRPL